MGKLNKSPRFANIKKTLPNLYALYVKIKPKIPSTGQITIVTKPANRKLPKKFDKKSAGKKKGN